MSLKNFIQTDILLPRLRQHAVLVVYDPERRYHDLCLELAGERRAVVDAGEGSIESRAAALAALQTLGQLTAPLEELLVYVPAAKQLTDEAKQRDPFSLYAACGAVFPASDGDEYLSLCLRYKADHATEVRRVFAENPNPSFAMIDAIGRGTGWPQLQTLLGVESARDILFALLVPSDAQQKALRSQETWITEAKALCQTTLGARLTTRARTWAPVADELWRFLLFSEFVFDLPVPLPGPLTAVPRAQPAAQPLVEDLCDRLRSDRRTQARYIERAETIEQDLNLAETCRHIENLGVRDTFPFEERSFFAQAVEALKQDRMDDARQIIGLRMQSVWAGKGENQAQWLLLQSIMSLLAACQDADRQLPDHASSQDRLLDFYAGSLRDVDRLQREFEQAAGDTFDGSGRLTEAISQARTTYRRLIDWVQQIYIKHLEKSGWPPSGRLANVDVFDKVVAPILQQSGQRVAVLLIDALRYELGAELAKQLADDGQITLQPAYAQLPSMTLVGMASLLPGAGQKLRLVQRDGKLAVVLGEQPLNNVTQRMDVLRQRYGQRFAEMTLKDFTRSKIDLPATVELLVLRSNEMDNDFESNPEAAPSLISRTFQQIRSALHKLRGLGFQDVVVVTDHGFYLNPSLEAGDVCAKPPGTWWSVHGRLLLGDGIGDAANVVLPAETLGIRGDFAQVAVPHALVAYQAGASYLHGGASLQETVVPVISVRLKVTEDRFGKLPAVTLSYKQGAKRITTRLPVIDVTVGSGNLFSIDATIDILVEAHDKQGQVVGEAKLGGPVNPATRTLTLRPNTTTQIALKMDETFEGKFAVKALDPRTLTLFSTLELETNYTV